MAGDDDKMFVTSRNVKRGQRLEAEAEAEAEAKHLRPRPRPNT